LVAISSDEEDHFFYKETDKELLPPPSPSLAIDMSQQQQPQITAPTMEQILTFITQQLEAITVLQ